MGKLTIRTNPLIDKRFAGYPDHVRDRMYFLRKLVRETAGEAKEIVELEETLKWGEPAFVTEHGSTLRMDWKPKNPNQYALYFQCTTRLVDTFRMMFGNKFRYEGNRAIVFFLDEKIPVDEVKDCILATLTYHRVKHLLNLGI